MKFTADRSELKDKLNQVKHGVGLASYLPVLMHVLLKAQDDRLMLRTTNLETAVEVSMSVSIEEEGACTVLFEPFAKWIGAPLPKDTVTITLTKTEKGVPLSVRPQCGRSYCILKSVFPEDEMPVARTTPVTAIVGAVDLIEAIQAVEWSVMPEKSATKIVCTGILLELYEAKIRLVAMDGFNAAMYDLPARRTPEWGGLGESIVINSRSTQAVAELVSGDVQIGVGDGFVSFKTDSVSITGTTIEGAYPGYEPIFAGVENGDKVWKVSKHALGRLLKLVGLFAKESYSNLPFIEVELSTRRKVITVNGSAVDVGDCVGSVQIEGDGAIKFGISPAYIKKAVDSVVGEELTFVLSDPKRQYLLKPSVGDRHKIIMMPMTIKTPFERITGVKQEEVNES